MSCLTKNEGLLGAAYHDQLVTPAIGVGWGTGPVAWVAAITELDDFRRLFQL